MPGDHDVDRRAAEPQRGDSVTHDDLDPRLAVAAFFGTASSIVSGAVFRKGEVSPQEIHRQFLQLTFRGLENLPGYHGNEA